MKSSAFVIHGGKRLSGALSVYGSKNAAFGILAATVLTKEACEIKNLPLIEDVLVLLETLKSIGVRYRFTAPRTIVISAQSVTPSSLRNDYVEKVRASVLLLGALSQRVARFSLAKPGGCSIGARILDPHFEALSHLGITIAQKKGKLEVLRAKKVLKKREIFLSEMSPTATENVILASVLCDGVTEIFNAAYEPFVQDVCHFLVKMGARISGIGTSHLTIHGVSELKGATHAIIPDTIEMGTFLALAAATKSSLTIKNTTPEFLRAELLKFKEANVTVHIENSSIPSSSWGYAVADMRITPSHLKAVSKTHNMPYPGFSADLLPIFAVLMTQAEGVSLIHDWMYEGRLRYIDELKRMGADAFICDPHRALITGPTPLEGKEITSFDLRAGATLIIAGLCASGVTTIRNAYQVDRGYEKIEERLRKIGADIKRVA